MHYIGETLQDEEKRKVLERHLESSHLLNEPGDDEETILRLAENNKNWLLLGGKEIMLGRVQILNKLIWNAVNQRYRQAANRHQSQLYQQ